MKLFTLLFLTCSFYANAQDSTFTVKGIIKNLSTTKMYIKIYNPSHKTKTDSVSVTNEGFSYTSVAKQPSYVTIETKIVGLSKKIGDNTITPKSGLLQFIAEPGATIIFEGGIANFVEAYPSGTTANNSFAMLCKTLNPLQDEQANINTLLYNERQVSGKIDNNTFKKYIKLNNKIKKEKEKFIKNNTNDFTSAWLLSDMLMRRELTEKEAKKYFDKMEGNLFANNSYYKQISTKLEAAKLIENGNEMPNFASNNTYSGTAFDLASLKGKYVIVDFWGTWCGPCVSGMPDMAAYYKKYGDKIQIVGVAQESDNGEKWKAFLQKNTDYNWIHILDDKSQTFIKQFNISAFPTKFIIDPNGKIIDKIIGEGKEFYKKLDKLMR